MMRSRRILSAACGAVGLSALAIFAGLPAGTSTATAPHPAAVSPPSVHFSIHPMMRVPAAA
jgi:hypothetical protein